MMTLKETSKYFKKYFLCNAEVINTRMICFLKSKAATLKH
jgi:hypothetical protein